MAMGGLIGAAMISDAFFPFRDGVDVALRQGIQAIAHAGGGGILTFFADHHGAAGARVVGNVNKGAEL
jgi:hypothetical protein